MNIKDMGELALIQRVAGKAISKNRDILRGIGDDASVVDVQPHKKAVITTDMLIEKTHFDTSYLSAGQIGYKCAAVNLSDIAAMGSIPRFALISIGLPEKTKINFVDEFYDGFLKCLKKYDCDLLGGDTVRSDLLTIAVTVIGFSENHFLRRDTAKPDDDIYVTGDLGDSAAGLALYQKKLLCDDRDVAEKLKKAHALPEPKIALGLELAKADASSAIDISDGLGSDLRHICDQSNVGAKIFEEHLPVSKNLKFVAKANDADYLSFVLSGGEDYELLFTLPPDKTPPKSKTKITKIGRITKNKELSLKLKNGTIVPLATGYEHFRDHSHD